MMTDTEPCSQCSALIISWKSCLVFFFMMDSQAPISAQPRVLHFGGVRGSTYSSSPEPHCRALHAPMVPAACPLLRPSAPPSHELAAPCNPPAAPAPTQAQQTMLLFQSLQFLGDEVLHLLDVHATAPLQKESTVAVRWLRREAPGVPAQPGGTHIVLCLQVARLLAQEAKHAGEVLVPDLAEDLQRAPQLLHTRPTNTCTPGPAAPVPAQPPPGAPRSASVTHCHHGTWAGLTLSWALSSTLTLLSEEVTSGPKSTLPAEKDEE